MHLWLRMARTKSLHSLLRLLETTEVINPFQLEMIKPLQPSKPSKPKACWCVQVARMSCAGLRGRRSPRWSSRQSAARRFTCAWTACCWSRRTFRSTPLQWRMRRRSSVKHTTRKAISPGPCLGSTLCSTASMPMASRPRTRWRPSAHVSGVAKCKFLLLAKISVQDSSWQNNLIAICNLLWFYFQGIVLHFASGFTLPSEARDVVEAARDLCLQRSQLGQASHRGSLSWLEWAFIPEGFGFTFAMLAWVMPFRVWTDRA